MDKPVVSVVVVVHDRAAMVDAMLSSVRAQIETGIEAIVMLNDATGDVRAVVGRHSEDERVHAVTCPPGTSASVARNLGVDRAASEIFYFLDDDTEVPATGVSNLLGVFRAHPEVDIVGGPNLTPPDDPEFAHMTGAVMASRAGTGIARSRYASVPERAARERHLILCNLAVRRRVFDSGIRFPILFGGEENTLMGHAQHDGFRLWYSPDVWVFHRRRVTVAGYVEQLVRYGRGRALAMRYAPGTFHVAYLMPVGLVMYAAVVVPLAAALPIAILPMAAYGAFIGAASARIAAREKKPHWLPVLPPLFALTHLAYGYGLLRALLTEPRDRGESMEPPK